MPNGYYLTGTQFVSRTNEIVVNWPEQHYQNGLAKNKETRYRFKKIVRSLKNINSQLPEQLKAPSFLIESLVYNAPSACFLTTEPNETLRSVLFALSLMLQNENYCLSQFLEVNGIKSLFNEAQAWNLENAKSFIYFAGKRFNLWP